MGLYQGRIHVTCPTSIIPLFQSIPPPTSKPLRWFYKVVPEVKLCTVCLKPNDHTKSKCPALQNGCSYGKACSKCYNLDCNGVCTLDEALPCPICGGKHSPLRCKEARWSKLLIDFDKINKRSPPSPSSVVPPIISSVADFPPPPQSAATSVAPAAAAPSQSSQSPVAEPAWSESNGKRRRVVDSPDVDLTMSNSTQSEASVNPNPLTNPNQPQLQPSSNQSQLQPSSTNNNKSSRKKKNKRARSPSNSHSNQSQTQPQQAAVSNSNNLSSEDQAVLEQFMASPGFSVFFKVMQMFMNAGGLINNHDA